MDLKYLPQQQNSEHYVEGEVLEQGAFMETTGNHSFQVVGGESLPYLTPQPPFCQSQWGSFIQCFLELYPAGWQCTFVSFPPSPTLPCVLCAASTCSSKSYRMGKKPGLKTMGSTK